MATRKTTFEVVKLAEIASLLGNAEVLGNTEDADREAAPASILSISYDPSLAATREMLFTRAGFRVFSVSTVEQATQLCAAESFDLIVIGHSIPIAQRQLLIKEIRSRCGTPVLALYRRGELPLTGADYAFDSMENPPLLLETVVNILAPKHGTARGDQPAN
jgi:DNA-binding NtrC family response regulator